MNIETYLGYDEQITLKTRWTDRDNVDHETSVTIDVVREALGGEVRVSVNDRLIAIQHHNDLFVGVDNLK